jgi:hypothetical protein
LRDCSLFFSESTSSVGEQLTLSELLYKLVASELNRRDRGTVRRGVEEV